jgi:hypothetical protein
MSQRNWGVDIVKRDSPDADIELKRSSQYSFRTLKYNLIRCSLAMAFLSLLIPSSYGEREKVHVPTLSPVPPELESTYGERRRMLQAELDDLKQKSANLKSQAEQDALATQLRDWTTRARALNTELAAAIRRPDRSTAAPAIAARSQAEDLRDAVADNRLVKIPDDHWQPPDGWKPEEKEMVYALLNRLKPGPLRDWIGANIVFNRADISASPNLPISSNDMISMSGSTLNFKNSFFSVSEVKDIDGGKIKGEGLNARRESLVAFEAGKAFYDTMENAPVGDGKNLSGWTDDYRGKQGSTISAMRTAQYRKDNFAGATNDVAKNHDVFGYLFRAELLKLDKPKEQAAQQKWDAAIRDFDKQIRPLLGQKP